MTRQEIIDRLITEFNYAAFHAPTVAARLEALDPRIKVAFDTWWMHGIPAPDLMVEGYSFESLIARHRLKPVAAFLSLDWLLREPERAKATLQRGFDSLR